MKSPCHVPISRQSCPQSDGIAGEPCKTARGLLIEAGSNSTQVVDSFSRLPGYGVFSQLHGRTWNCIRTRARDIAARWAATLRLVSQSQRGAAQWFSRPGRMDLGACLRGDEYGEISWQLPVR